MIYSDPETVPAVWEVGDLILDKYEVRQIFTGGGMGLVYRVYHRDWGIDLAVKSPRPEYFRTEEHIKNFEREADTWVNLGQHPHTVSCCYVRRLGGIPRIFAEFVDGGSLADWIRSRRLYEGGPEKTMVRILDIAIQFAWGLQYAHDRELIHQDVKPGNVLLTNDGTVKVTDFGLVNALRLSGETAAINRQAGQSIRVEGAGLMTAEYASPEQLRGDTLSRRTDIWSWAVSMVEILAEGRTWSHSLAVPHVLTELYNGDISADTLASELMQCLAKKPEDRTSTMVEVANKLILVVQALTGKPYPRELPRTQDYEMRIDHNKALSLLDLKGESAKMELRNVAIKWPSQIESRFAHLMFEWRDGKISDLECLTRLQRGAGNNPRAFYCLGLVQLERGATREALSYFEKCKNANLHEAVAYTSDPLLSEPLTHCIASVTIDSDHLGESGISASVFLADGSTLVMSSITGRLSVYSLVSNTITFGVQTSLNTISTIVAHPERMWCAIAGSGGHVEVWDLESMKRIICIEVNAACHAITFDSKGELIIAATQDGAILAWHVPSGAEHSVSAVESDNHPFFGITTVPGLDSIIAAKRDGTFYWWSSGCNLIPWKNHDSRERMDWKKVNSWTCGTPRLAICPMGYSLLASNGEESELWDIELEKPVQFYPYTGCASSRNSPLAVAYQKTSIGLFDWSERRIRHTLWSPNSESEAIAPSVSMDGGLVAFFENTTQSVPTMGNRKARPGITFLRPRGFTSRLNVWNISELLSVKDGLRAPLPFLQPPNSAAHFQSAKAHRLALEIAEERFSLGEYTSSVQFAEAALALPGFERSAQALAFRWNAGTHLVRDNVSDVFQRATLDLGGNFLYYPDHEVVLVQTYCGSESELWEFRPDRDGHVAYGGFGLLTSSVGKRISRFNLMLPQFLGRDPVHECIYLDGRVYLENEDNEIFLASIKNSDFLQNCFRNGSIVMIGRSVGRSTSRSGNVGLPWPQINRVRIEYEYGKTDGWLGFAAQPICFITLHAEAYLNEANFIALDVNSRREAVCARDLGIVIAVDISACGGHFCAISHDLLVIYGTLPKFKQRWRFQIPSSFGVHSVKRVQFSFDSRLMLADLTNHLWLFETETGKIVWELDGPYYDAYISIDSRFLFVETEHQVELHEIVWRFRQQDETIDLTKLKRLARVYIASRRNLAVGLSSHPITSDKGLIGRLRKIFSLAGLGDISDDATNSIIVEIMENPFVGTKLVDFDNYDISDQAAFDFYWDYAFSTPNLALDRFLPAESAPDC
jgi:serine/threonine protein kinase